MPHFIYLRKKIKSKLFLGNIIAPHGFLNYFFILLLPMCIATISRVSHLHGKVQFCCGTNHTFPALSMAQRSLSSPLELPDTLFFIENTFLAWSKSKEANSKVHISLNRLLSFHFVQTEGSVSLSFSRGVYADRLEMLTDSLREKPAVMRVHKTQHRVLPHDTELLLLPPN